MLSRHLYYLYLGIADIFIIYQKDNGHSTDIDAINQCDPLNMQACLLPFPSDYNMVNDETTYTGKRVQFKPNSFPKTRWGTINPEPWNKADGFFHCCSDIVFV